MEEISKGISRLLWFFYRAILTLVPATFFLLLLVGFLYYNFGDYNSELTRLKKMVYPPENSIEKFSTGQIVIITLLLIIFCNILIEAIVLKLAYRVLGFQDLSDELHKEFREQKFPVEYKNMKSPFSVFNLMEVKSLKDGNAVFEHVEYVLAREFLFNNSWVFVLTILTFFLPSTLNKFLGYPVTCTGIIIFVEFVLSATCAWLSMWMIRYTASEEKYNHFGRQRTPEAQKVHDRKRKEVAAGVFIASICAMAFFFFIPNLLFFQPIKTFQFWNFLVGINLTAFITCYFLMSAGFREYLNVDKIVHAYFLLELKQTDIFK